MVNEYLINPKSIVVVGGSNDNSKPGGKVLKNLLSGHYQGDLYVINPKEKEIQGVPSFQDPGEMPDVDLAILAIAARLCPQTVDFLAREKNTRAFIILSAGFGEESEEGARWERQIVTTINDTGGCLIGPNCIGFMNQHYYGIFTTPLPETDPQGVDFVSGSGATAVFIMESVIPKGLKFSSVYSVGNSAQLGVEDVVRFLDETYDPKSSSRIKLLYLESVNKPKMLLKHATSLVRKGCKIAAIKAGSSEAGSRAATSHTGAMASSDSAVDALFRKSGIIRCYSREELAAVGSIFHYPMPQGNRLAIITHAGGPAVMLTDVLSDGGMEVPHLEGPAANALLNKLYPGSSVANPIDFLATGTAEQLGAIIDACEHDFDQIDGMIVIFGSSGLFPTNPVYDVLHSKMNASKKPIYPVLPSVINAHEAIQEFISKKRVYFPDEVIFGRALCKVLQQTKTKTRITSGDEISVHHAAIRRIIEASNVGYLSPDKTAGILDAAGIPRVPEESADTVDKALTAAKSMGFPLAMKSVGPIHKSDVGGLKLNVDTLVGVENEFQRLMAIPQTTAVLIQPMMSGLELFAGVKKEGPFGHILMCGLGGIFVETIKDVAIELSPIQKTDALEMIKSLKGHALLHGVRNQEPVDESLFAEILVRLSMLVEVAPEISEMDLNPLIGNRTDICAVDVRIRIEK